MEDVTSRPTHRLSSCILLLISLLILHNRKMEEVRGKMEEFYDGRFKREEFFDVRW